MGKGALAACLLLVLTGGLHAEDRPHGLETLYEALAESGGFAEAQRIGDEIWRIWMTAPDPSAQALLDRALAARRYGDHETAHRALDALVARCPDYAEGWNQRATLFYEAGRDREALDAVDETLVREPRHFGALAGRVLILLRMGRPADARRSLAAALAVHPWLPERALLAPD